MRFSLLVWRSCSAAPKAHYAMRNSRTGRLSVGRGCQRTGAAKNPGGLFAFLKAASGHCLPCLLTRTQRSTVVLTAVVGPGNCQLTAEQTSDSMYASLSTLESH